MKKTVAMWLLILLGFNFLLAQQSVIPYSKTDQKILDDFMNQRLGMFIHWGPVTLRGTEIGWSRNNQVPQNDYDSLYKEFDPVLFNADNWVKTAKEAGMKYLTITAKHHDGFCLWPTAFTDYNIMHTPYHKDVVGALAQACKKYDIKFCVYFSVLDWYNKNYPSHNNGNKEPDPKADMHQFVQFMKNQLKELVQNYHPYMLWFDGNWEKPWTLDYAKEVYAYLKQLDSKVIINNRLGKNEHDMLNEESVGDYATPEQKIGKLNMSYPWESCITLCNQWAWKPNDKMKSLKQCIYTLASTSGGNGNLLLNIGPMPDGRIEARQVKRLKELGNWLRKYGASIYSTKGGPFTPDSIIASTRKGNNIYIHLFQTKEKVFYLPSIPGMKIMKAHFLNGNPVTYSQDGHQIALNLPAILPDENDAVVVLEMDQNVEGLPIMGR